MGLGLWLGCRSWFGLGFVLGLGLWLRLALWLWLGWGLGAWGSEGGLVFGVGAGARGRCW